MGNCEIHQAHRGTCERCNGFKVGLKQGRRESGDGGGGKGAWQDRSSWRRPELQNKDHKEDKIQLEDKKAEAKPE